MNVVIALDAMGGDFGPCVVVEGADLAFNEWREENKNEELQFLFFGDEKAITSELAKFPKLAPIAKVINTPIIVTNEMKPMDALRHKDDSNLGMSLSSVANGEADAVVSAGNTGAYVVLSKVILGTLNNIDRPAIPAIMPSANGRCVVLDLGATLECSHERLTQFALMGEALARVFFKKDSPSVGLLNVGAEEMKGNAIVQTTFRNLIKIREKTDDPAGACSHFNFYGFVEGNDIFKGVTDVVVTDGFSGNIALKAIEGVIWFFFQLLKSSAKRSLYNRILALFVLPLLKSVKRTIDPRLYNGAVLLGLKKIAVKSHGNADAFGFAKAIKVAINMVESNFIKDIEKRLLLLNNID